MTKYPDFKSKEFLLQQIKTAADFFYPTNLDKTGGFYNIMDNQGKVVDFEHRSLVHTCRSLFTHYVMYQKFGKKENYDGAQHAMDFLTEHHRNPLTLGYPFELNFKDGKASFENTDNVTYGFSFIVLAYACAMKLNLPNASHWLEEAFQTMENHLWEPKYGLYADQCSDDWSDIHSYRGQNCNMHACEAMLHAYEATNDKKYLQRAEVLAENITVRQAGLNPRNAVWEHFEENWDCDPDFNFNNHEDIYRPWGYLTGHQTEWTKFLLILNQHSKQDWQIQRAKELFDEAVQAGWDNTNGGLYYSYGHDGTPYNDKKELWVHAETLGAAAYLIAITNGDRQYVDWYDKIWQYAYDNLVDHKHGGWFSTLDIHGKVISDVRGAPDPDYHNMGACADIMHAFRL